MVNSRIQRTITSRDFISERGNQFVVHVREEDTQVASKRGADNGFVVTVFKDLAPDGVLRL